MLEASIPNAFLAACIVEPEVFELRPDYRAMILVTDGLEPNACTQSAGGAVNDLIETAETHARTRSSLEALTRRAAMRLPRVNALTDMYNAISVLHQNPFGAEIFHAYRGPARLVRSTGEEAFDTVANGEPVIEHPERGEVVWRDDAGVTCRQWNWRQGQRTALTDALSMLGAQVQVTRRLLAS